jgi:hypothetical protein
MSTTADDPAMSTRRDRSLLTSPAVLLAGCSSCAVIALGALGALTAPVVAAALGVAGAIAVLRYREARPLGTAHVLNPLKETSAPAVILAPKAGEIGAAPAGHTDAA